MFFLRRIERLRVARNVLVIVLIIIVVILSIWLIRGNGFNGYTSGRAASKQAATNAEGSGSTGEYKNSGQISDLKCESAIAVDLNSGKVLYSKDIHKKLYPASLTKLMTALLLSEHYNKNDQITYTVRAKNEPANRMGFFVGNRLTADNAMKALLIFSANDIATTVAENVSGNVKGFADLMNQKAKALGMKDTHFANANGLSDSNHYTSAYDISILARKVYQVPWIIDTMETPSAFVRTTSGKGITVYNTNKTLGENGCFAGKTGNTAAAGWCLTAYYHSDGRVIVGIVMKSPSEDRLYIDMRDLIAFAKGQK